VPGQRDNGDQAPMETLEKKGVGMPKKVHRLAKKLQKKGYSEDSAWAIANSRLGKKKKK
jgi:hypothetical protein